MPGSFESAVCVALLISMGCSGSQLAGGGTFLPATQMRVNSSK